MPVSELMRKRRLTAEALNAHSASKAGGADSSVGSVSGAPRRFKEGFGSGTRCALCGGKRKSEVVDASGPDDVCLCPPCADFAEAKPGAASERLSAMLKSGKQAGVLDGQR